VVEVVVTVDVDKVEVVTVDEDMSPTDKSQDPLHPFAGIINVCGAGHCIDGVDRQPKKSHKGKYKKIAIFNF
jgi:hypothetical protein